MRELTYIMVPLCTHKDEDFKGNEHVSISLSVCETDAIGNITANPYPGLGLLSLKVRSIHHEVASSAL